MYTGTEIAIVGISGRFPGAASTDHYWDNLINGTESIRFYSREELVSAGVDPELINDPDYVPANGALEGIDQFDAEFFGFSPRDAAIMDPQHRLFLECCWEALESSGYNPSKYDGSIGVYAGSGMTAYMMYHLVTNPNLMNSVGEFLLRHTGNDKDFLTTRVSYNFDLKGPSVNVQTACSTSLVAVHMASQNLLNGECDMALAGGVTILLQQDRGYLYEEGEILSPDGHCRPFDQNSEGTIFGSGCGVVVLKRLDDALADRDTIHAIVRGSAINNDGSMKVSYLAPSVDGQAQVVAEALAIADLEPTDISYIEAHGTGTPVGDPIEVTALKEVFGNGPEKHCAIGSVKSNIGHLDTAAGAAGLIKVVEALKNQAIPPTLHFTEPNPKLGLDDSPFYVADKKLDWPRDATPRRAGISSLGVGGTNAHVILEEAPVREQTVAARSWYLLPLSARTDSALDDVTDRLARFLETNPDTSVADVAYTLSFGRAEFDRRRVVAVSDARDAVGALRERTRGRVYSGDAEGGRSKVVFMFAGGGAQYPGMGKDLYDDEPVYREAIDECLSILESREQLCVRGVLFESSEENAIRLQQPSIALPALFSTSYAVAKLLTSRGIEPAAMTGHSMGEYTAACLAGVMSLSDALSLVAERGRLFEKLDQGGMLSVDLAEDELRPILPADLSIAAVNAPGLCVASGPDASIGSLENVLDERDVEHRRIKINVAAHSKMVEPILNDFRKKMQTISLEPPSMPFISNVSGTWITTQQATDPEYWVQHIRETVRFSDGIGELLGNKEFVFLEVGPGRTLSSLVRMNPEFSRPGRSLSTLRHPQEEINDSAFLLTAVGQLWLEGVELDWNKLFAEDSAYRIPLPTYPFERQRHWIEAGKAVYSDSSTPENSELVRIEDPDKWFYSPSFDEVAVSQAASVEGTWLIFGDDSEYSNEVSSEIEARGGSVIHAVRGSSDDSESVFYYAANNTKAFVELFQHLAADESLPDRIVYVCPSATIDSTDSTPFYDLLAIEQAVAEEDFPTDLTVVTKNLFNQGEQTADARRSLAQSLALGPVLVGPRELSGFTARLIDVDSAERTSARRLIDIIASAQSGAIWKLGGDSIYLEQLRPEPAFSGNDIVASIAKNGVYLITGGLGGIGTEIASHLASEYGARLVLTGRSDLPARSEWNDLLGTNSHDAIRIRNFIALENAGADVLYVKADVRKESDLKEVRRQPEQRFGAVNGLFHAAGVLRDNLIQMKTADEARRVLGPKVAGTDALEKSFDFDNLDFVVLFSSTSSRLGLPGQIDYASANAYLNAFARYASAKYTTPVFALNWGMWSEVGMTASDTSTATEPAGVEEVIEHHLFDSRFVSDDDVTGFSMRVDKTKDWFFTEHQVRGMGPVLPGTMYIEIALAAAESVFSHRAIEVKNLFFLAPCTLHDADQGRLFISLDNVGAGYRFTISSFAGGSSSVHVTGLLEETASAAHDQQAIETLFDRSQSDIKQINGKARLKQEDVLQFGPRWKNLETVYLGDEEAMAELVLPHEFSADLGAFAYHPALLDMATGFALPLIPGFDTRDGVYAPLSYKSIVVRGRIPARVIGYARYRGNGGGAEVAPFDIMILDEEGNVIADIQEFVMRHTQGQQLADPDMSGADGGHKAAEEEPELVKAGRAHGIRPDDGIEIINRVLASGVGTPEVVATTIDYDRLSAFIARMNERAPATESVDSDVEQEAARDDVERTLCGFWEDLLGVGSIGINQDFFDAGGHSLVAVRLFTKIRKKFGVELSLASLFTAPTIKECANLIRAELGIDPPSESAISEEMPAANNTVLTTTSGNNVGTARSRHEVLVPIRKGGKKLLPFYCVHGAGGNVLNFWDISRHLGDEQPFFGLQMRGVDGKHQPPTTIEEMAEEYIEAIRAHQPEGPYCIGGYSGGGVVAYEMARRLQNAGQQVAFLGLFDTFCPTLPSRPGKAATKKIAGHIDALKANGISYLKKFTVDRYRFERNRMRKKMIGLYHRLGLKLPIELRDIVLVEAYHRAQDRYEVKPYHGTATLFTASIRGHAFSHVEDDLGWDSVEGFDLEIVKIPGDHDTLVLEPNVNVLASQLQKRLSYVGGRTSQRLRSAM